MMKKKIILILASLAIGITSCKKDFLNLQTNPNAPSSATPGFILSAALNATAAIVNQGYSEYGVWAGYWVSSGNYVPSPQLQQYSFTTDNYQQWTNLYNNLSNYNALITQSSGSASLANFQAIGMIMTAWDFEALVDNYNNVPYSQAFQPGTTITPAYDKGSDIYDALLKKLDAAIALIAANTSASSPGTADIVFGGNMTKWQKFANTIKLRLAIRQYANVPAKDAALTTSIAATSSVGYIDGTFEADANPGYANVDASGGQQSPFWLSYGFNAAGNANGNNIYYRANNFAVYLLNAFNDPRLSALYLPLANSSIAGLDFGTQNPKANTFVSAIGNGLLKSPTMNAVIMSSAESLFLQAEAAHIGLIPGGEGTALADYNAGITASFVALGLTAAQATTYYSQSIPYVSYTASVTAASHNANTHFNDAKIQAIITQKWIALNGYGNFEAYNELRRTGYPAGVPSSVDPAAISPTSPIRVLYPTSEYSVNPANVAAQGTISPFTSQIFWMGSSNFNTKQ